MLSGRCLCQCNVGAVTTESSREHADLIRNLSASSLRPLVDALLSHLPDDPTALVITVKSEGDAPPANANVRNGILKGPVYDPAVVYLLELCTVLALRDPESTKVLGSDVASALQNIMRHASDYHSIMVSRAAFYLLHLLHVSYVSVFHPFWDVTDLVGPHLYSRTRHLAYDCELQEGDIRALCPARSAGLGAVYQGSRSSEE